jgi:hypothetical protein
MSEHDLVRRDALGAGIVAVVAVTRNQSSWGAQALGGSCRAANSLVRSTYDGKLPSFQQIVCGVALGAFTLNTAWTSIPA